MSLSYYFSEASTRQRIQQRQTAEAYRANVAVDQSVAERIDALYRAYPNMPAGQIVAIAKSGVDITSPEVQQIADASFDMERKKGAFDAIGDILGGAKAIAGTVLTPVGKAADFALGEVDENLTPAAKAAVRTGFVVLETPFQEVQTFIRNAGWAGIKTQDELGADSALERLGNLVNPANWDDFAGNLGEAYETNAGGSSGRETVSKLLRGEDVDLGSGFLPAGEIEEDIKTRSKRLTMKVGNVSFGGPNQSITAGRAIAATVSEPGETAYNVISGLADAGVAWFGDPAAALGGVAKTTRASARVGRAQRALRGGEGLVQAGLELATDPGFTKVVDRSLQSRAAEGLGGLIDDLTGRVTGHGGTRNTVQPDVFSGWLSKGGRRTVERIAETTDFHDLWEATGRKLPVALTRRLADASDPQQVANVLEEALGQGLREAPEFLGFKVRKANKPGFRMAADMPAHFIDPQDPDQAIEQLDRWLRNAKATPELRKSAINRLAYNDDRPATVTIMSDIMGEVAAELAEKIRPRNVSSATKRAREMTKMFNADVDALRAYASDEIVANAAARGVVLGDDFLEIQKPYLLTEYLNNVIPLPEPRDIRRATSKLGRLVDNPFFEQTTGALEALNGTWKKLALLRGAYTVRVVGEEQVRMAASGLDSMFAHPISFISALVGGEASMKRYVGKAAGTGRKRQLDVFGDDFFDGAEAASDELAASLNKASGGWVDDAIYDRNFVLFGPEDDGYQRAWAQAIGEVHRDIVGRKVAEAGGNLEDVKDWFFRRQGRKFRRTMIEARPELATQAGSDQYIETVWQLIQDRTQGDPLLLEAITTGRINGAKIGGVADTGRYTFSDELLAHLDDVVGPEAVKGQRVLRQSGGHNAKDAWDKATNWAFTHLMTKPTNYLSRSPSFRQRYWQRIEEQLPYMDDATRAKAMAVAESTLPKADVKRMRQATSAIPDRRTITDLEDADDIAKAFALDETKRLLYDMTERGQFFDAARLIFPFGEAWKEVVTRWAKIGTENPRVLRRGQQLINGARGNGFFHKDTNGEEVFTFPFSRQLSKTLIGVPVDLNGRVAGLSLMTEVLPGVGPVVQVPAAAFLPDGSEWNWAREFISPFGEADYSQGFVESFLPGWTKNLMQAAGSGSDRQRNNTVMQMYDYLASTGEYDLSNPADTARLFDDARTMGSRLFALRGLTQFFAPTSPLPDTLIEGEKGDELLVRREVITDLYKLQEEHGYEEGMQEFIERYGPDVLRITQGMTKSMAPVLPVSKESSDWVRDNADLVHDYGLTWGMFAPNVDGEIDLTEYGRQIATGDRVPLTVEQRAALANAKVGRWIYDQQAARMPENPTTEQREWLAAIKEKIRQEYPGYGQLVAGVPQGADLADHVIPELRRALLDPRIAGTEAATALSTYLQARDRALQQAEVLYGTKLGSQAAAPLRDWLRKVAGRLSARYPSFAGTFDRTFSYELEA